MITQRPMGNDTDVEGFERKRPFVQGEISLTAVVDPPLYGYVKNSTKLNAQKVHNTERRDRHFPVHRNRAAKSLLPPLSMYPLHLRTWLPHPIHSSRRRGNGDEILWKLWHGWEKEEEEEEEGRPPPPLSPKGPSTQPYPPRAHTSSTSPS